MKILFDQGTPVPLRAFLKGHSVCTAFELGWHQLKNGDLIRAAEEQQFDAMVTTDSNLKYQQNLQHRRIAIVVLRSTSWPKIRVKVDTIVETLTGLQPGAYVEVGI